MESGQMREERKNIWLFDKHAAAWYLARVDCSFATLNLTLNLCEFTCVIHINLIILIIWFWHSSQISLLLRLFDVDCNGSSSKTGLAARLQILNSLANCFLWKDDSAQKMLEGTACTRYFKNTWADDYDILHYVSWGEENSNSIHIQKYFSQIW